MNRMILYRVTILFCCINLMCVIAATQSGFTFIVGGISVVILGWIALMFSAEVEKMKAVKDV